MGFCEGLIKFGIFCLFWYFTPISTWIVGFMSGCIPRYMDVSIGSAGVASSHYKILSGSSRQRVRRIGEEVLNGVKYEDKDGYKFTFDVIDTNYVNAFAYPGGAIFITDEMLDDLKLTDAEVAATLAHEIGHVIQRHSIKGIVEKFAVTLALSACFYEDNDNKKESWGEALGEILLKEGAAMASLTFSRDHEFEADESGWEALVLSRSGYSPQGMISLFDKLMLLNAEDDGLTHWHSTHPGTKERILKLVDKCGSECKNRPHAGFNLTSANLKQPAYEHVEVRLQSKHTKIFDSDDLL